MANEFESCSLQVRIVTGSTCRLVIREQAGTEDRSSKDLGERQAQRGTDIFCLADQFFSDIESAHAGIHADSRLQPYNQNHVSPLLLLLLLAAL